LRYDLIVAIALLKHFSTR